MSTSANSQTLSVKERLVVGAKSAAFWLMDSATLLLLVITVCLAGMIIVLIIPVLAPILLVGKGLISVRQYMQNRTHSYNAAMYKRLLLRMLRRNRV